MKTCTMGFFRPLMAATIVIGFLGCATPPKPRELEALEKLRASPAADAAGKKAPTLMKSCDELLKRSQKDWQSNDLPESIDAALMGQIKLKHAIALSEQDQAKARVAAAEDSLEELGEEQQKVQKDLADMTEKISLLKKLNEKTADEARAEQERAALAQQMEAEKRALNDRAETAGKISAAELAIKTADTVQASSFAKIEYTAALDTLARAQAELQKGSLEAAQLSADLAKKKADEAIAIAQPQYAKKAQSDENRARAEGLWREASAIVGTEVRRDARGSLQRVVIVIPAERLFTKKQTVIGFGKDGMLEPIAALIKKKDYENFPVQVVGYADARSGSSSSLLALTQARAQQVQTALMSRGVDGRRMVASGKGGEEPIATAKDRNRNNRVEIIFLYQ